MMLYIRRGILEALQLRLLILTLFVKVTRGHLMVGSDGHVVSVLALCWHKWNRVQVTPTKQVYKKSFAPASVNILMPHICFNTPRTSCIFNPQYWALSHQPLAFFSLSWAVALPSWIGEYAPSY